jgi:hypothetical protein
MAVVGEVRGREALPLMLCLFSEIQESTTIHAYSAVAYLVPDWRKRSALRSCAEAAGPE